MTSIPTYLRDHGDLYQKDPRRVPLHYGPYSLPGRHAWVQQ